MALIREVSYFILVFLMITLPCVFFGQNVKFYKWRLNCCLMYSCNHTAFYKVHECNFVRIVSKFVSNSRLLNSVYMYTHRLDFSDKQTQISHHVTLENICGRFENLQKISTTKSYWVWLKHKNVWKGCPVMVFARISSFLLLPIKFYTSTMQGTW